MKQYEAVIETMESLDGVATLGQLYQEVLKVKDCEWKTRTPLASIRRIVQLRPEIYKIKPGLYGLVSHRKSNEAKGIIAETSTNKNSKEVEIFNHYYYQGLLLTIGNLRRFNTFSPNQDKNKNFLGKKLSDIRSFSNLPAFSYSHLVKRSAMIDVIWFNERAMPDSFFEVEASTDIYNSLLKFVDLQDFYVQMFIVADEKRLSDFKAKISITAFKQICNRAKFLDYESVVLEYENSVKRTQIKVPF